MLLITALSLLWSALSVSRFTETIAELPPGSDSILSRVSPPFFYLINQSPNPTTGFVFCFFPKILLLRHSVVLCDLHTPSLQCGDGNGTPLQYSCLENPMDGEAWWAAGHGVAEGRTRLSDFTFTFHFHALDKEMATHSSVLAWRIPGMGKPGRLPSLGSHRVGHE